MFRVGLGYDCHRLVMGRDLVIGGVKLDSQWGEAAHSDGDVLIHALIDSLLSPLGEGDIGVQYPDNDPRWKGVNSLELLADTQKKLPSQTRIHHIDAVVILDSPKISPYVTEIREKICTTLAIPLECFHVKGKTSENTKIFSVEAYCVSLLEIG